MKCELCNGTGKLGFNYQDSGWSAFKKIFTPTGLDLKSAKTTDQCYKCKGMGVIQPLKRH
jgi:hypothetical protein